MQVASMECPNSGPSIWQREMFVFPLYCFVGACALTLCIDPHPMAVPALWVCLTQGSAVAESMQAPYGETS